MKGSAHGSRPFSRVDGKGTIRAVISLLILGGAVFAGVKFIPVRAAAYQLNDEVREQIVLAGSGRRRVEDAEIRRSILNRAEQLGIHVDSRSLVLRRSRAQIQITLEYTIPVELPGYTYNWHFVSDHSGPVF